MPETPAKPAVTQEVGAKPEGAKAVKSAGSFLTARQFGMPRWAFIALLGVGIIGGLWWRARRAEQQRAQEGAVDEGVPLPEGYEDTLAANLDDPGLAGVGIATGGGSVIPVASPTIPEGFVDVFETLGSTIGLSTEALMNIATGGGPSNLPANAHAPIFIPSDEYYRELNRLRTGPRVRHRAAKIKAFLAKFSPQATAPPAPAPAPTPPPTPPPAP